jgi:hypothetical protein
MSERVFLLCDIVKKAGSEYLLRSRFRDGGTFELSVHSREVKRINDFTAWMVVETTGSRDGVASIVLPNAILNMGRQISVPEENLSKSGKIDKPKKATNDTQDTKRKQVGAKVQRRVVAEKKEKKAKA